MVEALYINGIFQSVLEEIVSSQVSRPEESYFLQPYYYLGYVQLRDSPPTPENPITLYASVTSDLHHISHVAEIVGWEDKTVMSSQRKAEVDKRIRDFQPKEVGFNEGGRTPADRPSVNLLTIRNLQKLGPPFSITELIKDSDGTPLKPRVQPGGFSYVRRRETTSFLTAADVATAIERADGSGQFDPQNVDDARERVAASIVRRQGQPEFRNQLLRAYGGRCAITGYDVEEALEAAHIYPYKGTETNHVQNGLLLRADIHTLFDLGLIGIHPDNSTVWISKRLKGTSYDKLDGGKALLPEKPLLQPDPDALRAHLEKAKELGRVN